MKTLEIDLQNLLPSLANLTEQEWAEHDRRVRASHEADRRRERLQYVQSRKALALSCGAPARLVREAIDPAVYRGDTAAARAVARHRSGILVLAGGTGAGKSLAATRWLLESGGGSPAFLTADRLESAGRYGREAAELRRTWEHATAFVLDDLGDEPAGTSEQWPALLSALWHRFSDSAAMVVTTNLLRPDFDARYPNARLQSRMRLARWVNCPETDMRRKAGELVEFAGQLPLQPQDA